MTLADQLTIRFKEIHLEPPEDPAVYRLVTAKLADGYVMAVAWKAHKSSMAGVFHEDLPWQKVLKDIGVE